MSFLPKPINLSLFRFKYFDVKQEKNPLKVGTDSMLLGSFIDASNHKQALDLGAGTGVLSLMIAQKNPTLVIDAIEIHTEGMQECRDNFSNSTWADRLTVFQGDYFDFPFIQSYDLIFSNPPFYLNTLQTKYRDINLAKHGNSADIFRFFNLVQKLLVSSGKCWVIFPGEKLNILISVAADNDLYPVEIIQVHSNKSKLNIRVIICFSKAKSNVVKMSEITIRNENGNYSESYLELTEQYHRLIKS